MKSNTIAILLGGLAPAFLFAGSSTMQKVAARTGIGTGPSLAATGLAIMACGGVVTMLERNVGLGRNGVLPALGFGVLWGAGVACISIAMSRFGGKLSQLVPLYNMNTLVAVAIGLVAFSEWQTVSWARVLVAAVLIVAGGILAATA